MTRAVWCRLFIGWALVSSVLTGGLASQLLAPSPRHPVIWTFTTERVNP